MRRYDRRCSSRPHVDYTGCAQLNLLDDGIDQGSCRTNSSTHRLDTNRQPSSVRTKWSWSSPTVHGRVVAAPCPATMKTVNTVVPSAPLAPSTTKRMFPQ